jgi:hypothetical protein
MTEEAKYIIISRRGDVEFREYDAHVLVSVTVPGSFEAAPTSGFYPLVRYISGENRANEKIAMTSPVFHVAENDELHTISFVLPDDTTSAPAPINTGLSTTNVAPTTMAAIRFPGRWDESRARRIERELHESLQSGGVVETGPVMFARYDPPWKPGFLRRNEVLVPVDRKTVPKR